MINTSQTSLGNFVEPALLGTRLDATYYTPAAIQAEHKLIDGQQLGLYDVMPLESISSYIMDFQAFSIYNFVEFSETYKEGWVEFLRVQDLQRGYVDTSKVLWTSPESHNLMKKSQVLPGDILLSIIGTLGVAARWTKKHDCNSNQCIAKIRLKPNYDPGYVIAALNSPTMQILIHRDATGTVQKGLSLGGTRRLRLPIPDPKVQAYIGDKVRLAERCREVAQTKRSQIEYLLDQHAHKADIAALLSAKPQPSHNIEAKIINDRLDAEFYQPHYLDLVQIIQARPYQKLGDVIHLPIKGVQPEYDSTGTVPALTGTDIDPYRLDLEGASRVNMEWAKGKTKALAVSNEILFTVTGPPLGEAAVVHSFQAPLVINSHVARIKTRQSFPYQFYLAALMNSIIVSAQVYRYCKGVRQKELYPEDIMQFVIPEVDIEIVRQINNLGYAADFLEYRASGLIREAIADVENLIEGKLEMSEIMASNLIAPTWEDIEHQLQDAHA